MVAAYQSHLRAGADDGGRGASPSRIFAGHPWNSRIRPGVYRPFEFVIPGTTDAADEMVRHIRHRQPLRQSERQWLDIEVTGWPAGRAFDLKEFAVPCEIAESYWATERWRSAPALGLVPIPLQLDELGQPDDQPGDFLRLLRVQGDSSVSDLALAFDEPLERRDHQDYSGKKLKPFNEGVHALALPSRNSSAAAYNLLLRLSTQYKRGSRKMNLIYAFFVLLLMASPLSARDVKSEIVQLNEAFDKAYASHDFKALADFCMEDAVVYPQGSDIIKGRKGIQELWKSYEKDMTAVHYVTIEVLDAGDYAIQFGKYNTSLFKPNPITADT